MIDADAAFRQRLFQVVKTHAAGLVPAHTK